MRLIGNFLARFKDLTPPHDSIKEALSRTLEETVGVPCTKDRVSIQNGVAHIRVSSVAKNTIQINRSHILERLFERLPKARDTIRDVR